MIDPHHEYSWTYRRLTEIALAGSGLRGAGVSLRVLLHAFAGRELVWYSTIYGDHDENILLVAVDPETAASLEKLPSPRPTIGPGADSQVLEEYALSDRVAADLGVRFDGSGCSIEPRDSIQYEVYIHDDCFFLADPEEDALREQLLHCILRQHSFYLETAVDWSDVLKPLTELLCRTQTIRLKSERRAQRVIVSWEPGASSFFRRVWKRRPSCEIITQGGVARWSGGDGSDG